VRGIKDTVASLAHHSALWKKMLAAAKRAPIISPQAQRLTEVTGFGSNPGQLRMFGYVPPGLPPSAPLIVVLHGCTQTAAGYDHGTGWSILADRYGFAVLLPEQQRTNNPNLCFNWFQPEDIRRDGGEPLSIRQMVEHMIAAHRLDRSQVYVTGLSAGGAMAAVMLATYPDLFAGGAIVAGLPYGCATTVQEAFESMFQARSRPAGSWGDQVRHAAPAYDGPRPKVSIWHGSADTTVVPANATESIKQWTDVHGLAAEPTLTDRIDGYPHAVWMNAAGEVVVEAYTITGMAHGVPIDTRPGSESCGNAAPFILDAGISSTFQIARFWNLTGREARATDMQSAPHTHRPAAADTQAGLHTAHAFKSAHDPDSIIRAALRAAGLLRS
jgi:feruloyl esterase